MYFTRPDTLYVRHCKQPRSGGPPWHFYVLGDTCVLDVFYEACVMIHVVGLKLYMWGIPDLVGHRGTSMGHCPIPTRLVRISSPPYIMYITFYRIEDSNLLQFGCSVYIWHVPILYIQHSWYIWAGRSGILKSHIVGFGWVGWLAPIDQMAF